MQIKFYLDKRSKTRRGHPIKILFTQDYERKLKSTGHFSPLKDWDMDTEDIKRSHPNFLILKEKLDILSKRIIEAEELFSHLDDAIDYVFGNSSRKFSELAQKSIERNYSGRTAEGYLSALKNFEKHYPNRNLKSIHPRLIKEYKNIISNECKPHTVHTYLRKLDTLWSDITDDKNPFKGIRPKLPQTPSKHHSDRDTWRIINTRRIITRNNLRYSVHQLNLYRYYWMLQFYLGGVDMFDLANFRYDKNVIDGRINFHRGKGSTGTFCSNRIFPEAQELLDLLLKEFDCYPYLTPIYKQASYKDFVSNYTKRAKLSMVDLELHQDIKSKSARYTFINRGKMLRIDERITEQLVGHTRINTHSIYTTEFHNDDIDEAHEKIIRIDYKEEGLKLTK